MRPTREGSRARGLVTTGFGFSPEQPVGEVEPPVDYLQDENARAWYPVSGGGTTGLLQSKVHTPGSSSPIVFDASFDSAVTAGSLLVILAAVRSMSGSPSISGWTAIQLDTNGFNSGDGTLFYKIADGTEGTGPFAIDCVTATQRRITMAEFSGPNGFVDSAIVTGGASASYTIGDVTPTNGAPTTLIAAALNSGTITGVTGYTTVSNGLVEGGINGPASILAYKAVDPASGNYNATVSQSSVDVRGGIHVAFSDIADPIWIPAPLTIDDDDATYHEVVGHEECWRAQLIDNYQVGSARLVIGTETAGSKTYDLEGQTLADIDADTGTVIGTFSFTATGSYTADTIEITITDAAGYEFYRLVGPDENRYIYTVNLYNPPAGGGVTVHEDLTGREDPEQHPADAVTYDPTDSGLTATDVQAAIDEVAGGGGLTAEFAAVGAKAYNSTTQSVANDTVTALTMDSEEFDTHGFHSTSSNTSRLTIPAGLAGKYLVTASTYSDNSGDSDGIRILALRKNGTDNTIRAYSRSAAINTNNNLGVNITAIVDLVAGDYVETTVYQNSGSSINFGFASSNSAQSTISLMRLDAIRGTLGDGVGAKAYNSTTQTMNGSGTNSGNTLLTFDSEEFDTHGFHSTSSQTSRMTIPAGMAGTYMVGWFAHGAPPALGTLVDLWKNGAVVSANRGARTLNQIAVGNNTVWQHSMPIGLVAGDYLELNMNNPNASTFTVGHASAAVVQTAFWLMRIDSGSTGDGQLPKTSATRASTSITLNGTSWANVDTALDLTIPAQAGDVLLVGLSAVWGSETLPAYLDAATLVSGSPVNYISGGAGGAASQGVMAWRADDVTNVNMSVGGGVQYTVVSGDLTGGNVVLRLRGRTETANNKTLFATSDIRLSWNVVNLRSRGIYVSNEVDYAQYTSPVSITATTEATANTIVTGNAVTYDGSTTVMVEYFAPSITAGTTFIRINLYDGSSSIGHMGIVLPGATRVPVHLSRRLTPSAASHTYSIRGHVDAGTGSAGAESGGNGNYMPGYIRITRV